MSDQLPEGWAATSLRAGLISDIQTGFACGKHSRDERGIAHIRPMNISEDGQIVLDDVKYIDPSEVDRDERWLRRGDVVFNNTNSPELVGKTALYEQSEPRAFSNHMTRLRCADALDARFCALLLHHRWQQGQFQEKCNNHVSQASVGREVLLDTEVDLPPLPEQRRVVSQVHALLEQVNRAKGRLNRLPFTLKRFRQAVLAAACSGELTREWRESRADDASPLLTMLGAAALPADDEPAVGVPGTWRWVATEDLCDKSRAITYGVIKLGEPVARGVPTLRSSDVRPLFIDETGVKKIAPEIAKQYTRTFLRGGEVLVTVRGTLGGIAVVPSRMAGFNISREVAQLPVRSEVNADFVAFAVASITSQNWLSERAKGVAYTGINIEDLRRLPLPVPPASEQVEIVQQVQKLFALAETIESHVQAATIRADKLPQAILSKAFTGELVPTEADLARGEGRTYETAEHLLARVRLQHQHAAQGRTSVRLARPERPNRSRRT